MKKDYCTLFFDKIKDYDISGCCLIHDDDYENGVSRKEADNHLRVCVNNTTKSKIGNLMFLGVRAFGWIFWYWHRLRNPKS